MAQKLSFYGYIWEKYIKEITRLEAKRSNYSDKALMITLRGYGYVKLDFFFNESGYIKHIYLND